MNIKHMETALELAQKSFDMDEVPVGAVVVKNDTVIGWGYNTREHSKNALDHAEMKAIDMACKTLGGWRLFDCDLYVTLEPCSMCAGAIINARIENVYFGAHDTKYGACGSVTNLFECNFNHKPIAHPDIMGDESRALLKEFFKQLRERKKQNKKEL